MLTMTPTGDLRDKTIVITGATSGLGRGTAVQLAAAGANVVIAGRRDSVLDALAHDITASGGTAHAVSVDVSDPEQVARLADAAVEEFGGVDVWVNNAGIGAFGRFWEVPAEDHARVIDVNLTGLIYGAHVALRLFEARGRGILVNVSSVESEVPLAYQSSYAATKAAVKSLGRTLNEELRLAGLAGTIRVSTVMPWAVDTPFWVHAGNYTGARLRMAMMDGPRPTVDAIVAACACPRSEHRVGAKARIAGLFGRLLPGTTDRVSGSIARAESDKGSEMAPHPGSIHRPTSDGVTVSGGIRRRMKEEDSRADDAPTM
jgi:NAD(P)-dependent dehydrogenase (short-subunit alcohol dehydrogenase family)